MRSVRVCFLAIVLVAGGCEEAVPELSSADVHGSARLSAAERKTHIDRCVSLKHEFLQSKAAMRIKQKPDERFDDQVDRACDCIVNAIEDRASKMQFLLVMGTLGRVKPVLTDGRDDTVTARFQAAASKHGMSASDFAVARRDAGRIAETALQNCRRFTRISG